MTINYAFTFQGKTFTPDGRVALTDADAHNQEVERKELLALQAHPDRAFLYVKEHKSQAQHLGPVDTRWSIGTWLGTEIDGNAWIGPKRRFACFGPFPSIRRAVRCRIFGALYVGWYFESSGDYCRLRKAKV